MAGLTGYNKAINDLKRLQQKSNKAILRGVKKVADKIAAEAQSNAPGGLSAGISVVQTENVTSIIGGVSDLAAYNEFGTGNSNTVKRGLSAEAYLAGQPEIVKEEARKFYINGQGSISARPFFFPAIFKYQSEIIPTVEEEIRKEFGND